jgi:hypothetical protein
LTVKFLNGLLVVGDKMDRKTREELNVLSKLVFGTTSRWQKLVNKGFPEPFEAVREVMVPRGGTVVKKTFKNNKSVVRHYTVGEVRKLMEEILESRKKAPVHNADSAEIVTVDSPGTDFLSGVIVKGSGIPKGAQVK